MASVGFFNIRTGEKAQVSTEPLIAAFISSSDMGVNASRGADMQWRLDPDWVKRLRAFRQDSSLMEKMADGKHVSVEDISDSDILYALYNQDVRKEQAVENADSTPYADEYMQAISGKPTPTQVEGDSTTETTKVNKK